MTQAALLPFLWASTPQILLPGLTPTQGNRKLPTSAHDATMTACTSMALEGEGECLEFSEVGNANTNY